MSRQKRILFVDDDEDFLKMISELFSPMGGGAWQIHTAQSHAQALEMLKRERMDLVVLDIGMPVMDGFQFLRLLGRAHPSQQVVMLTGHATEEHRKTSQENGALLLLEKPLKGEEFEALFAALNAVAGSGSQTGFRGMMRQVGLQEVLQMECLGKKSSILEIFSDRGGGRIYICDGAIVHADAGGIEGEAALYGLLGLTNGDFNLQVFKEPPRRTIEGPWEFLLMEAARLVDEAAGSLADAEKQGLETSAPTEQEWEPVGTSREQGVAALTAIETPTVQSGADWAPQQDEREQSESAAQAPGAQIEEVLLCSGAGELLHEWNCVDLKKRAQLLEQIEQQAAELAALTGMGRFDRLQIVTQRERSVAHIQPDRRLFVRSSATAEERS
jgi:CheY-like chemotaxis protein